jgi:hypothetical protein
VPKNFTESGQTTKVHPPGLALFSNAAVKLLFSRILPSYFFEVAIDRTNPNLASSAQSRVNPDANLGLLRLSDVAKPVVAA